MTRRMSGVRPATALRDASVSSPRLAGWVQIDDCDGGLTWERRGPDGRLDAVWRRRGGLGLSVDGGASYLWIDNVHSLLCADMVRRATLARVRIAARRAA